MQSAVAGRPPAHPTPEHPEKNARSWFSGAIILAAVGVAFLPVRDNGFTNLDEPALILENPWVLELSWAHLAAMFTTSCHYMYSPLAFLAFALEKQAFGLDPRAFHTVTLLLHLGTVMLLFSWIASLTGNGRVAAGTALLYGLHPLNVESVAWATGQRTVLFGFFFFAALAAFARFENDRKPFWYGVSLVAFTLSLLAKGLAFTLPLVLVLQRWYRRAAPPPLPCRTPQAGDSAPGSPDRPNPGTAPDRQGAGDERHGGANGATAPDWRGSGGPLAPFFALGGVFVAVSWWAAAPQMPEVQLLERLLVASHGMLRYLRQAVFPTHLACAYPYPEGNPADFPWAFLAAPPVLLGLATVMWLGRSRWPHAAFGLGFSLIGILPVSQLVTVGMRITSSDHFMYVPLAGLCYAIAALLLGPRPLLPQMRAGPEGATSEPPEAPGDGPPRPGGKAAGPPGPGRLLPLLVFLGFAGALALATNRQCRTWKDSRTLYRHALACHPDAVYARHQLGVTLLEEEDWAEAEAQFAVLLAAHPDRHDARLGRATARIGAHSWREAKEDLLMVLAGRPGDPTARRLLDLAERFGNR